MISALRTKPVLRARIVFQGTLLTALVGLFAIGDAAQAKTETEAQAKTQAKTQTKAARAQATQELIDLHVEWLGGRNALEQLETMHVRGKIQAASLEGPASMVLTSDGRFRFDYDLQVVSATEVRTPEDSWRRNESGQIEDLGEEAAMGHERAVQEAFARWFLSPVAGTTWTALGAEEKNGRSFEVLSLAFDNGDRREFFIDAESGALEWVRMHTDNETVWTRPSDWRQVDGIRIPFRSEQIHTHATSNVTLIWDEVNLNQAVEPAAFARPATAVDDSALGGKETSGWLPMSLFLDRWIYLTGTINGHETEMLLDSGAGITVIDAKFAESIGLKGSGAVTAKGVGGTSTASFAQGVNLGVGEAVKLEGLTAAIIDLTEVEEMLSRSMPVIVGKEMFNRFVVDVDYPNERIAFHEPASFAYSGSGQALDLIADDEGHKAIWARIEDLPPAKIKLDTGAGGNLTIFESYWRENDLLSGRRVSNDLAGGVGGTVVNKVGRLSSFEIAGTTLKHMPVGFDVQDVDGAFDTTRFAGNLGAGVLGRFRCIFDYHSDKLILERGARFDRPFRQDGLGIDIQRKGEDFVIVHVSEGSPAEKDGWKVGDVVREINGETLGHDAYAVWRRHSQAEPGTVVQIVDGSGKSRKVTLAQYY